MRNLLTLLVSLMLLFSCGTATPEELASLAAKGYYEHLLRGEYDYFLEGKAFADSLPDNYRSQLLDGYRQFMAQQERLHGGIHDVRAVGAKADSSLHCMNVFLILCFGDSTNEQVAVPMVEAGGRWRMK